VAEHDIYAINEFTIPAQGQVLAETGIAIGLPKGMYARIAPRSGLASKKGIAINGGVIDTDYTREIRVIMINHGKADCRIQEGDRIAQLMIEKSQHIRHTGSGRVGNDRMSRQCFWEHRHVSKTHNISHRHPAYDMLSASRLKQQRILRY